MNIEVVLPVLLVAVFPVVLVLAVIGGRRAARARNARLREIAGRLGLDYTEPPGSHFFPPQPRVAGRHRGRFTRLYEYATGSGKNRKNWCAAAVACEQHAGLKLHLRSQGPAFFEKIAQAFGFQDVQVGDERFDARFVVSTSDPAFVQAALIPEIREKLLAFWPRNAGAKIALEGAEVVYAEPGSFNEAQKCARVEQAVGVLGDLAAVAEVYRR